MVLGTFQNQVGHYLDDVQSAHQTMQDSDLSHPRELVDITRSVMTTIGSCIE
jgi:hypothetical protein